ncbi:hypothetical protein [Pseudotabrizicola formosa]|uniref:hypothetical protein n=1 Tax=Pseudotabrizicola formosa TaxID=2030009 RepID=UPI0011AECCAD|nr:hypothetical protein [Pseudotabrizicola formosa]
MARGSAHRRMREGKPCILCGGNRLSEDTEHAPPKSLFHDKQRPQGYEFPSCKRCNKGPAPLDALAAFIFMSGRTEALLKTAAFTEHQMNLARTVARNFRPIFAKVENADIKSESGFIIAGAKLLELTPEASKHLATWSAKQAYAYWYHHTKQILSKDAVVGIDILTKCNEDDDFANEVARLLGPGHSMVHAKKPVDDQFFYRFVRDEVTEVSFVQAVYHKNGGFFAIIDEKNHHPEVLEKTAHRFQTSDNKGIHRIFPKERSAVLYGPRKS